MDETPPTTLAEARRLVASNLNDGVTCPCCGQFAKVYRRKINAGVARVLIAMYRASNHEGYVYIPDLRGIEMGGDTAKARYWGLIEVLDDSIREDGSKRVGWWRLTDKGRAYVEGNHSIPKYARIYNGLLLGLEGPPVNIRDALGSRFNYDDLMAGV